ncbi:MAG: hypothetical protein KF803_02980 [Cyclobacteriaceae bacterium]|nr:hypothetical protein [Cyclobacteriaceae bacterium]
MKPSISLLLFLIMVQLTSGQNRISCDSVSLTNAPVEQLDTLFDASLIQANWPCGLKVYAELKNRRDEIKDHFKGALCRYNLEQYDIAYESFIAISERTAEPIEYLNYYIGQLNLIHHQDTSKAINYLFMEIDAFPSSVFAYEKLMEILNIKSDYASLIRLENVSSVNDESESERLGRYHLSLNQPQEANQFFKIGCNPDAPNSCFLAAITSDSSAIAERIALLNKSLAYSLKLNEELIKFYESRDIDQAKEDSLYIVQEFKITIATYHSALSSEYDRNEDQANAIANIDRAFFAAAETPVFTAIVEQLIQLFKKYELTDRILFYQDYMNSRQTDFTNSIREATVFTDPLKQASIYLDALSSKVILKVSADTVVQALEAYVTLNYMDDFFNYIDLLEKNRSDLAAHVAYNLTAMRQFSGAKAMKFHDRLNDPSIYLNHDQFTWFNVIELFMTRYNHHLETDKNLDGAISSINDLKGALEERNEDLPAYEIGDIQFAEAVAYWRLCQSADNCQTAENLFRQAKENNPNLEPTINRLISTQPCGCR